MKYIKLLIILTFLNTAFTGCSYVSDTIEGAITKRASFSATAVYDGTNVIVTWDETDSSDDFAGIEIYITSKANDEYAKYEVVASRYFNVIIGDNLDSNLTRSYTDKLPPSGIYFYRVGLIHYDDSREEREDGNHGYNIPPDLNDYNTKTSIDAISGYAKVVIQ